MSKANNNQIFSYSNVEEIKDDDTSKKSNGEEHENKNNEENNEENNQNENEEKKENLFLKKAKQKENIDDIKYNPELFIIPEDRNKKVRYYSKMDKAVESYNKIKKQINNTILNKIPANYAESSHKITIMLDNMNKLN